MDTLIRNLIRNKNPDDYMEYLRHLVFDIVVGKINENINSCNLCDICSEDKSKLFCNEDSKFLFVNESPKNKIYPFSESVEQSMLKKVFEHYSGLCIEDQAFINAVNCIPYKNLDEQIIKRPPSKSETKNCYYFIEQSIEIIKPKAIILLGSVSLSLFKKESLMKERGNIFEIKGVPTISTFNPSYFIELEGKRSEDTISEYKDLFCSDIEKIIKEGTNDK